MCFDWIAGTNHQKSKSVKPQQFVKTICKSVFDHKIPILLFVWLDLDLFSINHQPLQFQHRIFHPLVNQ